MVYINAGRDIYMVFQRLAPIPGAVVNPNKGGDMKLLWLFCFALLFAGCGPESKQSLMGPPQSRGGADGTVVKVKRIGVPGPLLPGQVRPTYLADPDADESRVGDPEADD